MTTPSSCIHLSSNWARSSQPTVLIRTIYCCRTCAQQQIRGEQEKGDQLTSPSRRAWSKTCSVGDWLPGERRRGGIRQAACREGRRERERRAVPVCSLREGLSLWVRLWVSAEWSCCEEDPSALPASAVEPEQHHVHSACIQKYCDHLLQEQPQEAQLLLAKNR